MTLQHFTPDGRPIYRHKTWSEAFAAADARARATGWRYWVRRSPVGWWLVSRIPGTAWLPSVRRA